jgi:hypothetical protein
MQCCFQIFHIMYVVKVICSGVDQCLKLLNLENVWKLKRTVQFEILLWLLTHYNAVGKFRMSGNNGLVHLAALNPN